MNMKKLFKSVYPAALVFLFYVLVTLLRSMRVLNAYYIQVMMFAGINIMMTASLNLVNGFTGQFCIGHAGFMSLGAYGAAVVTTIVFHGKSIPAAAHVPVFLFLLLIVFNSNLIVFKKRIIDRINKIDEIIPLNFKIGTFVLIDLLPALTINLLLFFLVYILQINSNIYYIISLFLLTISSVLLAYLLGDIIDINYHRQINAVVMTMFMLVSGAFMYVRKPAFLIAELLFILFIILIMRKSK